MGWKIIEIETADHLNLFLNNLVIKRFEEKIIIPIIDIDVVIINNYTTKLTIGIINELSNNNILVIICNQNYLPNSIILPIFGNYNTLKILEKQINWTNDYKAILWQQIIEAKIKNQYLLLHQYDINNQIEHELYKLLLEVKPYDISNREGHASKIYWHALFTVNFKRHNDDYYNSLLNYGYTILRGYFCRSIIKKGLDPRIAIFHKSFHNHFALASDLMEPFRCIIDFQVYKIYISQEKDFYKHKDILINTFNNKIFVNDKKHFINNAIDLFIDAIVNQEKIPEIIIDYDEWL